MYRIVTPMFSAVGKNTYTFFREGLELVKPVDFYCTSRPALGRHYRDLTEAILCELGQHAESEAFSEAFLQYAYDVLKVMRKNFGGCVYAESYNNNNPVLQVQDLGFRKRIRYDLVFYVDPQNFEDHIREENEGKPLSMLQFLALGYARKVNEITSSRFVELPDLRDFKAARKIITEEVTRLLDNRVSLTDM